MEKNHNSWTSDFTSFAINSLLVRKNIGVSIDGRERKKLPHSELIQNVIIFVQVVC
jgi:hypothetical protein